VIYLDTSALERVERKVNFVDGEMPGENHLPGNGTDRRGSVVRWV
jgi:hypothetical protein